MLRCNMRWVGDVNVHVKYFRYRCYVVPWDRMNSYIPRTLSSRKLTVTGTRAALMKLCLICQWLPEVLAPAYSLLDQLGKLCKEHNHKVGLWRLAWHEKYGCLFALSETLNASHLHRRRNPVLLQTPSICCIYCYTCIHSYFVRTHTHVYTNTDRHIHIHIYVDTHIHIYIYTHNI